jgi:acetyltransferase-like isoleucine patch superfamily enzyme
LSQLKPSDLAPNLLLGSGVRLAEDVEIGANVVIHDDVSVGKGARLEHGAVLGRVACRNRRSRTPAAGPAPTFVEAGAVICPYALVSAGARLERHSFLGDHANIREGVRLGVDATVGAGCGIGRNAEIGDRTRLQNGAIVGAEVVVEPDCFLGPGAQVLTGRTMTAPARAEPPLLRRGCQIGAGALIMPGVEVGEEAIVGAGAVVTADVPDGAVVRGVPARLAESGDVSAPGRPGRDYDPVG